MQPLQVTIFIIGTVIVVFGAYYVTYYIGVKASGRSRTRIRNRNINMLDRFAISKDKSFCAVEIAGKVYIVGITNQSMTLLDTLSSEEYAEAAADNADPATWPATPGMQPGGLANRLLYFLAGKMKKPRGTGGGGAARGGTFADSMAAASRKSDHGNPSGARTEQTEDIDE